MTMPVSHVTVRVPLTIRRRPGRKTLVSLGFGADGGRISTKADPALVKALCRISVAASVSFGVSITTIGLLPPISSATILPGLPTGGSKRTEDTGTPGVAA